MATFLAAVCLVNQRHIQMVSWTGRALFTGALRQAASGLGILSCNYFIHFCLAICVQAVSDPQLPLFLGS